MFVMWEVDGMLGFFKLVAEALLCNLYYKKGEQKSPRKSSRLTENAEHSDFGLPNGTQNFGKGVVDADSSHLQSTCVDWKMMTWTSCHV